MKPMARFLFLLLLLSQASCKKDKSPDPGPLYIPQEVKDYAQFKPGTYWVYIDSVSGRVDSQYVFYLKKGFDTLTIYDNPSRAYEWFETAVHSEMDGYDYYSYCSTSYSVLDNSKFVLFISKSKPGHYAGKSTFLIFKPYKGQIIYDANAIKVIQDIYSVLYQNGIYFKDVIDMSYDKSAIDISKNVKRLVASHFSTIRKEYVDSNQIWVLARSNIIQ